MAGDGRFVITWTSENQDGSGSGIYGQLYDASGAAVGGEFLINETTTGTQDASSVAMADDGTFVVVWQSEGVDVDGLAIVGRRFGADGVALGGEFDVNDYETGNQGGARIAMDAAGNFVVTWTSVGQDGSGTGIYAQRFDRTGEPRGTEIAVTTETLNDQRDSSIAMAADGSFVIVWRSDVQDGSSGGIFGQRFAADGSALGAEFQLNTTTANDQFAPEVAMNDAGDFVVAWASQLQDGSDAAIVLRSYAADGTATSGEVQANTTTTNAQSLPTIAMDAAGGFTIAWQSAMQDGDAGGIYAQRFTQTTNEEGGQATFEVVLTGPPTDDVVVTLVSSDGTEGSVSPTTLTFTTANWSTPQTVTVTGLNDALTDGDVSYAITTSSVTSLDGRYAALDPADVRITNLDTAVNDAPTFDVGTGSTITGDVGVSEYARDVAVLDDGKILVVSYANNGSDNEIRVTRYLADGTIDTSFGGGDGVAVGDIPGSSDIASSIAVQSDGSIVVGGTSGSDFVVMRFLADGTLDPSFGGGDGIVTTDLAGGTDLGRDLFIQPDGKIVQIGVSGGDIALVRYDTDGTLDTTFGGGDGKVITAVTGSDDEANAGILLSDGRIAVAGSSAVGGDVSIVVMYNADGTLDTTYGGGDGIASFDLGGDETLTSIIEQPDGKLLVAWSSGRHESRHRARPIERERHGRLDVRGRRRRRHHERGLRRSVIRHGAAARREDRSRRKIR